MHGNSVPERVWPFVLAPRTRVASKNGQILHPFYDDFVFYENNGCSQICNFFNCTLTYLQFACSVSGNKFVLQKGNVLRHSQFKY